MPEQLLPAAENLWNLQCFEAGSVLCVQLTLPSDIHVLRWPKVSRTGPDVKHSGGTGGRSKMGIANKGVSDSRGRDRRRLEKRVINRAE